VESKKGDAPGALDSAASVPASPAQIAQIKEILLVLANAVSAAKIFPPEHQTVVNFVSDLHVRLKDYLERHWKLELGIEERVFTFSGKTVYEDPHPVKSLPFFFYKDGMQTLYFYRGLGKEELKGFLETIKEVSKLPPEEGDIVNALWEKDFANIRYSAPDDFLETRIGVAKSPLEIKVDREEFSRGRIDLSPEDLEAIHASILTLRESERIPPGESGSVIQEEINLLWDTSNAQELEEVESLLLSSRRVSSEEEYQSLVLEILYLEDRPDQFPAIAAVLKQLHLEALNKRHFRGASRLLSSLREIKEDFLEKDENKAGFIEAVIQELSQERLVIELEDSLDLSRVEDIDSLLSYLHLIGSRAVRLLAAVFERASDPIIRQKALRILEEIGEKDSGALMALAQDSKPALTREIIRLAGRLRDKKTIPYLAGFLGSQNAEIKLEAVRALGETADKTAAKVLLGFLADEDERVRTGALQSLLKVDETVLPHILAFAREKEFKKKSLAEIGAAFETLARSESNEACHALKEFLRIRPWWPAPRKTEIALVAAAALEKMAIPLALEALKEGTRCRSKKIKQACAKALSRKTGAVNPARGPETHG